MSIRGHSPSYALKRKPVALAVCAVMAALAMQSAALASAATADIDTSVSNRSASNTPKTGADAVHARRNTRDASSTDTAKPHYLTHDIVFNTDMLSGSPQSVDLSRFERANLVAPGTYNVDVFVNDEWAGRMNVRFAAPAAHANAMPCLSREQIEKMPLPAIDPARMARLDVPGACVPLDQLIKGATLHFDMGRLRLDASIPQAFMDKHARGYVDPASWDEGITAFLLNYNLNAYHSDSNGYNLTSTFLNLKAGLNIDLWHFRQNSVWSHVSSSAIPSRNAWHNIDAYVSRDLPSWRSRITLGDSHTDGAVFDSYSVRGVRLSSVDAMLPQSRRGYAPVIRGVAQSNAKVVVTRNGQLIYQTTVSPGPFVINDLFPSGAGGDITVTVTEADGSQRSFVVPYSSVGQLVRAGVMRYDVALGQLRNVSLFDDHKPQIIRGTVQYGFNNLITGYAGFQGSQGYAAGLVGAAFNTRFGALAVDLTQSGVTLPRQRGHTGQSYRLTWSQAFPQTQTRVSMAAYRYSTSGFLSLIDAVAARDYARNGINTYQPVGALPGSGGSINYAHLTPPQRAALATQSYNPVFNSRGLLHKRSQFSASISQPVGKGSLYVNASVRDYWNRDGSDRQYQLGYSNHIGRASWNVSLSRSYNPFLGGYDNRGFLSINIPLGRQAYASHVRFNVAHDNHGNTSEQASINGTAGEQQQYSWGATVAHGNRGRGYSGSVNAGYRAPYAVFQASAGAGKGFTQQSAGASGSMLITHAGFQLGQPMGETVALIHAPGAKGAKIGGSIGLEIGSNGYAIMPFLQAYQRNVLHLDPKGMSLGAQLEATSASVAPYAGSVVQVNFKTKQGRPLIARITQANGRPIPFGAQVYNSHDAVLGTVGQSGTVLLRGVKSHGQLTARWNEASNGASRRCVFAYTVPTNSSSAYAQIAVQCLTDNVASQPVAMIESKP